VLDGLVVMRYLLLRQLVVVAVVIFSFLIDFAHNAADGIPICIDCDDTQLYF
jgi:hypothetical protein